MAGKISEIAVAAQVADLGALTTAFEVTVDLTTAPVTKRVLAGTLASWLATVNLRTNDIGVPGGQGFGVGTCPGPLPAGMITLSGTLDPASDSYGNYGFSDGSVMVWIPAFYYKYGTGANGFAVNIVSIKAFSAYATVALANAAGYALHRAFYDGGAVQQGVFVDKYLCSNNAGTASSIKNGNPLSSAAAHNPFSGLTAAPPNFYYGAVAVAKTRGANFFPNSRFIQSALALLALAHAQSSTSTAWNAWYDATGITNFPKGCNNNALGDANDAAILYVTDGYVAASPKTGSANLFSRTTHNGQSCGVADLNGAMWEIALGLATDDTGATYYTLKTATAMKNVTGGTGGATDLWGAAGIAALYDSLGATYGAATATNTNKGFGAVVQVLSEATTGLAWQAAGSGIPLVGGVGGTNAFGNDYMYDARPAAMCPFVGGAWYNGAIAGVWALYLADVRGSSNDNVGCRAALYL
jgi:hypothetical protein